MTKVPQSKKQHQAHRWCAGPDGRLANRQAGTAAARGPSVQHRTRSSGPIAVLRQRWVFGDAIA
ncbi:hypothetical protein P5V34_16905, partial [Mycobacteroides abscessus subsp. abscessus]|uniref:hypothetical protein n=1 Tax=Mycobacteroides abscessus TaxID=36809 RepID=UPI00266BCA49